MTEIQMIVFTAAGHTIEGAWEAVQDVDPEAVANGLAAAVASNAAIPVVTDEGPVVIPARAVDHVLVRSRESV